MIAPVNSLENQFVLVPQKTLQLWMKKRTTRTVD